MNDSRKDSEQSGAKISRRSLIKAGLAAGFGGLFLARIAPGRRPAASAPGPKVSVLPSCARCTGCALVCPTEAILVTDKGPLIRDELCVRCGYCVVACPVRALRMNRESGG
jgi:ferredoxin